MSELRNVSGTEIAISKPANIGIYARALQSDLVCEMDKTDCLFRFTDLISKVYFISGQKISDSGEHEKNLLLLCTGLYDDILQYFKFIRIEEVEIALNNGVRGEYGEFFGLSLSTFHKWLRAYQTSEIRKTKLKEQVKVEKEVNKAEVKREYWRSIQRQFRVFKESGKLDLFMPTELFRSLWEAGFIKMSKAESNEYLDKAKERLLAEKEMLKRPTSKAEKHRANVLGALLSAFESGKQSTEQDRILKSKAAELAIRDYYKMVKPEVFDQLIEKEINKF